MGCWYFAPSRGTRYSYQNVYMSVSLSDPLSAHMSHKPHVQISQKSSTQKSPMSINALRPIV